MLEHSFSWVCPLQQFDKTLPGSPEQQQRGPWAWFCSMDASSLDVLTKGTVPIS